MRNSTELAADKSYTQVWDSSVTFPSHEDMCDPDIITNVSVTKAKEGGYYYLHEATVAFHNGLFYAGFANHKTRETGDWNELVRGCTSKDGLHWSEPEIWAKSPDAGSDSHNHPLIFDHNGTLYGMFVCWNEKHIPRTELFIFNDETGKWVNRPEAAIPEFVPFCVPQKNEDGDYVISGENHWFDAAVIISHGDDYLHWDKVIVPRPEEMKLLYPESAIAYMGNNHFRMICRTYTGWHKTLLPVENLEMPTAPTSESFDGGHTWTPLSYSNFPIGQSQPFGGRLSTGESYFITNSLEEGRTLLSIALTGRNGGLFNRIYKVRHTAFPRIRLFENDKGKITQLAYPKAFEHDGKLYIVYSQGKEDCTLSIIPIDALKE